MPLTFARHRTVLVAGLLFLGTILLFSRSLGFGFVNYDDPRYIYQNPELVGGFTAESLRWAFTGRGDIWNPLVRLTHLLDWSLFGDAPFGHHLHNLLWHAPSAALVFFLLRRLTGTFWTSALCAAVFAWHPLRVESVSWVSERKDVVSVAFGLLTLLAYTAYAGRRARREPAAGRYVLALATFAAALLAKPSMVMLPGLLVLLDFWPLRRSAFARRPNGGPDYTLPAPEPVRALLCEKLPFVALATAAAFVAVHTQSEAGDFTLDLPLGARLANALVSLPRYVGMFFWPFDLCVAYPHPGLWPLWIVSAAALAVAGVCGFAWRTRHTSPWNAVGLLWYVGMLLPMIGIVQVGFQSVADRYTYFPLLGFQIALFWTARTWIVRHTLPRWAMPSLAIAMLGGLCGRTWDQQKWWADSASLYEHAVTAAPRSDTAHAFLAYTYAADLKFAAAREHADRSLAINPCNRLALTTRARVHAVEQRTEDSIADLRQAIAIDPRQYDDRIELAYLLFTGGRSADAKTELAGIPRSARAWPAAMLALAEIQARENNVADAIAILTDVLAEHPGMEPVVDALVPLLHGTGRDKDAAELIAQARKIAPRAPGLLRTQGLFLQATGKPHEAIDCLRQASQLAPRDNALHCELGRLLVSLGALPEAAAVFTSILEKSPDFTPAAFEYASLLEQQNQLAEAATYYRRTLAAQPGFVPALVAIGRLAERQGQSAAADTAYQQALALAPQDAALHCAYAEVLARRRQFADALPLYQRATELAPDNAEAHAGFGYMLAFAGRPAAAVVELETALRLKPDFPGLRSTVEKIRRQIR